MSAQQGHDWLISFAGAALAHDLETHLTHIARDVAVLNGKNILFKTLGCSATRDGHGADQQLELLTENHDGNRLLKPLRILTEVEARSDGLI